MDYNDASPIKDVIEGFFKNNKIDKKYLETKVPTLWKTVMGEFISKRTLKVFLKDETLCVSVDSAPLRNELLLNRERVILLMNKALGKDLISNLMVK